MLQIINLNKKYKLNNDYTLKNINYKFNNNGLYFIIGKSGSGKTTLLSLLGGIDYDYEGSIKFNNQELKEIKNKENYRLFNISFAFQDYKANDEETVVENLKKCLYTIDITDVEIEKRIDNYLSKLKLIDKKNQLFKNLSGGEKKRISLIRALIKESDILLLDEPLASLNKKYRDDINKLLIEESKKRLVIVITHEKNEIPTCSTTILLENGNLIEISSYKIKDLKNKKNNLNRKNIRGIRLFYSVKSLIKSNRKHLSFSIFSLVIAFYSIIISFLLTTTINNSIKYTFNRYMDNNSLVIEKKEDNYLTNNLMNVNYKDLYDLKLKYPQYIENIHNNYLDDIDSFFDNNENLSLIYNLKSITLKNMNFKSLLYYYTFQEITDYKNNFYVMNNDEIVLGLKDDYILLLGEMLFDYDFPFVEDALELINNALEKENVFLNLNMNISKYNYHNNYSYKILFIKRYSKNIIINNNETFSEYFINNVLHFESKHIDEKQENFPLVIYKTYGLRLYNDKKSDFFSSYLKDEIFNKYTIKIDDNSNYYSLKEYTTHNRLLVFYRFYDRLDYSYILQCIDNFKDDVISFSLSSPIYTYTANSYMSGFNKPFFFSVDKSKLNLIEDEYYKSKEDLGSFQSSSFKVDDKVIKSDLFESVNNSSLLFKALNETYEITDGNKPKDYNEVLISTGLKEILFPNYSSVIDKEMYVLSLDSIKKIDDGYENLFSQGVLKISGIVKDDSICIYQENVFPLIYAYSNTNINYDEIYIKEAVINLSFKNNNKEYYLDIINLFEDLKGTFPMMEVTNELDKTIRYLSITFTIFSLISFIISFFLISINTHLIFKRNQKQIGVFLALGYQKKDIERIYFIFNFFNIIFSYLFSIILSIITEKIFKSTLKDIFLTYKFSFVPYLISIISMITLIVCIFVYLKIILKNISPKDSFMKN